MVQILQETTGTQRAEVKEKALKDSERTKCEVWTRVMGYFRPVNNFNVGKKGEFKDRKYFKEPTL